MEGGSRLTSPEEEQAADAARAAGVADAAEQEPIELGQADFSTDSPPRGAAKWRHGGNKADHVPRGSEPDMPVSLTSPGVARPGEDRLRVVGQGAIPAIPNVLELPLETQPMACLRDCFGMHANALPERVIKGLRDHIEKHPKNVSFSEDNG